MKLSKQIASMQRGLRLQGPRPLVSQQGLKRFLYHGCSSAFNYRAFAVKMGIESVTLSQFLPS